VTEITSPLDTPILLGAAIVVGVLLVVTLARRLLRWAALLAAIGVIIVALYWARAEGYLTW
jgi:hypothetical protein